MRQRNWIFYKIMLYLGLIAAIAIVGFLAYTAFTRFRMFRHEPVLQLTLLGAMLQIIFYILSIRLVHYYVPNRLQPNHPFRVGHTAMLIFNSCVAVAALTLLAFIFYQLFINRNTPPSIEDFAALMIVGAYTFVMLYTSAATIILRRYNKYQAATDEESWLNQLGNPSLNQ